MSLLIISGLLYLCGISTVLILKPELMFSADGNWKEFGLGRGREKYTWMPFWLFAITWAIISYMIVLVIASATGYVGTITESANSANSANSNESVKPAKSTKSAKSAKSANSANSNESSESNESANSNESNESNESVDSIKSMSKKSKKPGYYILNTENGSPKYIYLGPKVPNLVYNSV